MKKTEIILSILIVVAIILNFSLIPGGVILTVLTLSSLSCLYFAFSFALLNNIRLRHIFKSESYKGINALRIIGTVVTGWSLSLALNGILFKLLFWPGASINLIGGLFCVCIVSIICVIKCTSKDNRPYYFRILNRTIIVGLSCVSLLTVSSKDINNFKYRNYPAFIEAERQNRENPDNPDLLFKYEEERRKMDEQN